MNKDGDKKDTSYVPNGAQNTKQRVTHGPLHLSELGPIKIPALLRKRKTEA